MGQKIVTMRFRDWHQLIETPWYLATISRRPQKLTNKQIMKFLTSLTVHTVHTIVQWAKDCNNEIQRPATTD